jgi:hypothetical protein
MSIENRISRLEESRPPTATAYIWLDEGESQDAAVARYCAARGIEYLAPGVVRQFLTWNWANFEEN